MQLLPGQFLINVGIRSERGFEDHVPNAVTLEVHPSDKSAQLNAREFRGALIANIRISKLN
jgi:hypothetical protein